MIRGVDYLVSRQDVDAERIGAMGTSQGGGIVLAVGALAPRVKSVVAHVPFLCDMRRAASEFPGSLIHSLLLKSGANASAHLDTLDFFDPLNMVRRLRVPTLISAGGRDTVCPPDSIRAVF